MGFVEIVVPESTDVVNLVTNPSIENGGPADGTLPATTGYTASGTGASVAGSTAKSRRGVTSLAVTPGAGVNNGAYFGTVSLTNGQAYTVSVDVWGVNGVPYKVYFATTAGALKGTATTLTGNGDWQRVSVTWTADASTTFRIYFTKNNSADTGVFYIDGLLCVALDHDVLYFDGDSEGAKWNGLVHNSTSTLSATSRKGGRVYDLDDFSCYIEGMDGLGMPAIEPLAQEQPFLPGMLFQGSKIRERNFVLVYEQEGTSWSGLHSNRKALIDAIKPDRLTGEQAFWLRYTGAHATKAVMIECRYAGGLEFRDSRGFAERGGLRLVAFDPMWYEDGDAAAVLTVTQDVANADFIVKRIGGVWSNISTEFGAGVGAIVKGMDGEIYLGGGFQDVGDANGDRVLKLVGSTLSSLGTGMNHTVNALAVDAAGNLYAGGVFSLAGGVANTVYIAKWNGSVWAPLSTGVGNYVQALAIGQDGTLYVGGLFINQGDANGDRIVSWNGSAWASLGSGIGDGGVSALAIGPDGTLYVGGTFTAAGGVANTAYIAKWNGSAWAAMGSGMNGAVNAIAVLPNGHVVAGGNFTEAGGTAAAYIAEWDGSSWKALGSGMNNQVMDLAVDADGLLYAGGYFTTAGGVALADSIAVWNGSTWCHLDINLPSSSYSSALLTDGDDLYVAFGGSGTAKSSVVNSVTNNGTARAYPIVEFGNAGSGTATVEYLKNLLTGATIFLNYTLQPGEKLIVDFRPGKRAIRSSWYGNVPSAVLRNSDFMDFCLLPGANSLAVFVNYSSATITATCKWKNTHWSLDGVAA